MEAAKGVESVPRDVVRCPKQGQGLVSPFSYSNAAPLSTIRRQRYNRSLAMMLISFLYAGLPSAMGTSLYSFKSALAPKCMNPYFVLSQDGSHVAESSSALPSGTKASSFPITISALRLSVLSVQRTMYCTHAEIACRALVQIAAHSVVIMVLGRMIVGLGERNHSRPVLN